MIKLFVFDLGNVILPFEHRQIASKLLNRSSIKPSLSDSEIFKFMFDMDRGLVNIYEEGRMSSHEFFGRLKERYALEMTFEDFKDIWNPIFREDSGVNEVILYLKSKGYPLFLLSNTNELHFSYIANEYPIVHALDEWILSYKVGVKKPDKRIYDVIFERMKVNAGEVFYIDDIARYVDAARGFGINGLVYKDSDSLWEVLKKHGVC